LTLDDKEVAELANLVDEVDMTVFNMIEQLEKITGWHIHNRYQDI
jgi:succinate dehydrogenase flavin-adding protein (antitoxin of CptAB toxin-antitoxin module)